ncbi:hypothetical protein GCM10009556_018530 [Acrocarpospora pleiomorpha]|uniref:hypothetical protein n=1 Tax=Acrocarpospora pleiomorpha TaxID=90975 RepID=UPI0012D324C0|nr:hypothetical protein [Acrocarpospora pleiomorpha]
MDGHHAVQDLLPFAGVPQDLACREPMASDAVIAVVRPLRTFADFAAPARISSLTTSPARPPVRVARMLPPHFCRRMIRLLTVFFCPGATSVHEQAVWASAVIGAIGATPSQEAPARSTEAIVMSFMTLLSFRRQ